MSLRSVNCIVKVGNRNIRLIPWRTQSIRILSPKVFKKAMLSTKAGAVSTLVTFDVDGTLVESVGAQSNYLHKAAFAHGFKEVCQLLTNIDVVKHHGSTDPLIIVKVLEHHGISKDKAMERLPEVEKAMVEFFLQSMGRAGEGLNILPGVVELLTNLKASGSVACGLVTGNLEPIGWSKMRALGLLDLFSTPRFGGFGSDFCSGNTEESWRDRAQLIRVAAEGAAVCCGGPIARRFHVGDTPMDVWAALEGGATPIAVATGIFTREQLLESAKGQPIILLDNLKDTAAVIKAMGL